MSNQLIRYLVMCLTLMVVLGCAVMTAPPPIAAQCAMCKTALTGSVGGRQTANTMNLAILVLLVPPVTIFCSVFALAYKRRKPRGVSGDE